MRAFTSFMLILLIMASSFFPKMDMEEVSKLPKLFYHFQTHKKSNATLNFLDFLNMHYGYDSTHKDTDNTHNALPLFQHQCTPLFVFITNFALDFNLSFSFLEPLKDPNLKQIYTFIFAYTPFQPPKF